MHVEKMVISRQSVVNRYKQVYCKWYHIVIIGAGLSEPHTRELVENLLYVYMYVCIVRNSICSIKSHWVFNFVWYVFRKYLIVPIFKCFINKATCVSLCDTYRWREIDEKKRELNELQRLKRRDWIDGTDNPVYTFYEFLLLC